MNTHFIYVINYTYDSYNESAGVELSIWPPGDDKYIFFLGKDGLRPFARKVAGLLETNKITTEQAVRVVEDVYFLLRDTKDATF